VAPWADVGLGIRPLVAIGACSGGMFLLPKVPFANVFFFFYKGGLARKSKV
jgi:hypothetical protein